MTLQGFPLRNGTAPPREVPNPLRLIVITVIHISDVVAWATAAEVVEVAEAAEAALMEDMAQQGTLLPMTDRSICVLSCTPSLLTHWHKA